MWSLDPSQYLKGLPLHYITDFDKVGHYFPRDYRKIKPEKMKISDTALTSIESYNKQIRADSAVFENIEALKEVPAVVTGQQPCLLTGPLYVMYKALTAVITAERHNCVPVFWNASEDDDISEVDHIWVMNSTLEKISVRLDIHPFSKIMLKEEDIQTVKKCIETLTPPTEFRKDVLEMIGTCSLTFSEMFSQLLSRLFTDYGLIVVEPHIFAEAAAPVYRDMIKNPTRAARLVNAAGDSLQKNGYKRQVHKSDESCSFYIIFDDKRHAVTYDKEFHVNNTTYTGKELLDLLDEDPSKFTSTVISRPLIQDAVLPTLAYCAGPGEVSYFAQMKDVYTYFHITEPYIIPRFGATILEKKIQKVLTKYAINIPDLTDPDRILKILAQKDIQSFFNKKRGQILNTVKEIEEYMATVDINLKKTGAAMRQHIANDLKTLEGKTTSALKNQNRIAEEQITKASLNIFPNNTLQERVLNVFQYLIRYNSFIQDLYDAFQDAQPGDHAIITPGD